MKQIVSAMVVLMIFGLMSTGVTYAHVKDSKGELISNCRDTNKIITHCEEQHSSFKKFNKSTCTKKHKKRICTFQSNKRPF